MIHSMTGFGHCEKDVETGRIRVEIRSVNHRYLDLNLRVSHRLHAFEQKIRSILKSRIIRGKVDVSLRYDVIGDADATLIYNESLAAQYVETLTQISQDFNLSDDITATKIAFCNDVLSLQETNIDPDTLWADLEDAINQALDAFLASRREEGHHLKDDLLEKLSEVKICVDQIQERSPQIIEEYKAKITQKVRELLDHNEIDEQRIAMEVVLFADKICVDEEIVRLKSHVTSAIDTLNSGKEVGRKMDFIAQEMNREANTILSKSNDATVSEIGITLKTLIEKIREQIQNLE